MLFQSQLDFSKLLIFPLTAEYGLLTPIRLAQGLFKMLSLFTLGHNAGLLDFAAKTPQ